MLESLGNSNTSNEARSFSVENFDNSGKMCRIKFDSVIQELEVTLGYLLLSCYSRFCQISERFWWFCQSQ